MAADGNSGRTRRHIVSAVLIAGLALATAGCGLLVVGGAAAGGAGAAIYYHGKLEKTVDANVKECYRATHKAFKELEMPLNAGEVDYATGSVESNYADGTKVWVDLEQQAEDRTTITVRVGYLGDKQRAMTILEHIEKHLDT